MIVMPVFTAAFGPHGLRKTSQSSAKVNTGPGPTLADTMRPENNLFIRYALHNVDNLVDYKKYTCCSAQWPSLRIPPLRKQPPAIQCRIIRREDSPAAVPPSAFISHIHHVPAIQRQ
jgi:hypothetical protein